MTPAEFRLIRNALGLTQEGLARALKSDTGTITRWERDRDLPSSRSVPALLDALLPIVADCPRCREILRAIARSK